MFTLANHSAILFVTSLTTSPSAIIFTLFTLGALIEYKNLVLEIPKLATKSHITIDNSFTI